MIASGKKKISPTPCADSGPLLTFALRWLLHEPAFREADAGDGLVRHLEAVPASWTRQPGDRGFPSIPIRSLDTGEVRATICDVITRMAKRLASDEAPPHVQSQPEATTTMTADRVRGGPADTAEQVSEVLQAFVRHNALSHTRDADGGFELSRAYEPWLGREVFLQMSCRGADRSVLQVLTTPDRMTPLERWADVMSACNGWNLGRWSPKAHFWEDMPEMHGNRVGQIVGEASVDVKRRVDPDFVSGWLNDAVVPLSISGTR
jgi:hypothetical protein